MVWLNLWLGLNRTCNGYWSWVPGNLSSWNVSCCLPVMYLRLWAWVRSASSAVLRFLSVPSVTLLMASWRPLWPVGLSLRDAADAWCLIVIFPSLLGILGLFTGNLAFLLDLLKDPSTRVYLRFSFSLSSCGFALQSFFFPVDLCYVYTSHKGDSPDSCTNIKTYFSTFTFVIFVNWCEY